MSFFEKKKRILIIAASGGIGFAITEQLCRAQHRLYATTRAANSDKAVSLRSIAENDSCEIDLIETDLGQENDIAHLFNKIHQSTSELDMVINCSGLLHDTDIRPEKKLEDLQQEHLARLFEINSIAPLLIAKYALPFLRHKKTSLLVNISARVGSISDNRLGGWYGYRASKAAQNMATKTIAIELKRRSPNTIVVGLHPGTVNTTLSLPFQKNVSAEQLKTPDEAALNLLNILAGLISDDSGKVFAWDKQEILP